VRPPPRPCPPQLSLSPQRVGSRRGGAARYPSGTQGRRPAPSPTPGRAPSPGGFRGGASEPSLVVGLSGTPGVGHARRRARRTACRRTWVRPRPLWPGPSRRGEAQGQGAGGARRTHACTHTAPPPRGSPLYDALGPRHRPHRRVGLPAAPAPAAAGAADPARPSAARLAPCPRPHPAAALLPAPAPDPWTPRRRGPSRTPWVRRCSRCMLLRQRRPGGAGGPRGLLPPRAFLSLPAPPPGAPRVAVSLSYGEAAPAPAPAPTPAAAAAAARILCARPPGLCNSTRPPPSQQPPARCPCRRCDPRCDGGARQAAAS